MRGEERSIGFGAVRAIEDFLREKHRPRDVSGAAVELAVDEVRAASEEESDRSHDDEIIAEIGPRNLVPPGVVKGERDQPEHAAMARHSAFPNPKN